MELIESAIQVGRAKYSVNDITAALAAKYAMVVDLWSKLAAKYSELDACVDVVRALAQSHRVKFEK